MKQVTALYRIIVLITLLICLVGSQPATADSLSPQNTILVNTSEDQYGTDSLHCSLREAIQSANEDIAFGGCTPTGSGADTITFSSSITTFQLSIGGGINNDNSAGDLNIKSAMTIQGNGEQATIIDAFYQATIRSRIFAIDNEDQYTGITVMIKDLSIINGNSQEEGGGAIHNEETLILEYVTIANSLSKFAGGAIYFYPIPNTGQSMTLRHCTISDNVGTNGGGGIKNSGVMTIEDSYFSNNWASSSDNGIGGAIVMVIGGTLSISRTIFDDNQAGKSGGTLYLTSKTGPTLIEDSVITNGSAATGNGGNIYASFESFTDDPLVDLTISNTEISNGAAFSGNGGGIYNDHNLSLENVTLSGNNANYGGGLYTGYEHSMVSVANSTIARNSQTVSGAGDGIYYAAVGAVSYKNSIFAFNGYNVVDPGQHGSDCAGSLAGPPSQGYNLDTGDSCLVSAPTTGDLDHTDPLMGGLQNNYGFSQTHALSAGSPAIDHGNNATCLVNDQRGWYRPLDGPDLDEPPVATCDIGAYEFGHRLGFLPVILRAP
jgi:CSLREA domain-containing protein